jgi:2-polyprenyl-3-methyl-5-hydroxy-6-metoxy-1,4-benzoquinol methylase
LTADSFKYVGPELELFAAATVWKSYLRSRLESYIRGRVLEVGAGLGGSTVALCNAAVTDWICLEPDVSLAALLSTKIDNGELPRKCSVTVGTLQTYLKAGFDTVIYMDVLEHIPDHAEELARAANSVGRGGHVIVLAPAHQWLYTPFDEAVGHYRRSVLSG